MTLCVLIDFFVISCDVFFVLFEIFDFVCFFRIVVVLFKTLWLCVLCSILCVCV